jgi:serine/threonine protein phosphatase 1
VSTYAVGDIHGLAHALRNVLAHIRPRIVAGDTVVFLGDYIDRGPDSRECIDQIIEFAGQVTAPVVTLLGNHEQWLLRTRDDYANHSWLLGMEGLTTVASYSPDAAQTLRDAARAAGIKLYTDKVALPYEVFFDAMPESHRSFFDRLQRYHRTADAFCSHGGCNPAAGPLDSQSEDDLVWGTRAFIESFGGPDFVVYGHWGNARADDEGTWSPARSAFSLGIDTSAHGIVTAIRLPEGEVFQGAEREP